MSNNLRDLIRIALASTEDKLRTDEIHDRLAQNGIERSERRIKQVARGMNEEDELCRESINNGTRGRPAYRYYLNKQEDATGEISVRQVQVRGDIEPQEDWSLPEGAYWEIIDEQASTSQTVREIKTVAPKLADKDPVDLHVQMCEWTVETLQDYGERINQAAIDGEPAVVRALRSEYEDLADWADDHFHDLFRLPKRDDPCPEALYIPEVEGYISAGKEGRDLPSVGFDEDVARNHFSKRIFGDKLIQVAEVDQTTTDAVGTDASVSTVALPAQERLAPETRFDLLVGGAALDHAGRRYTDYDYNPRSIRDFRHREAFQKGLILSTEALSLRDSEMDKARAAAMDLRQYRQCHRVINNDADWEPYGNFDHELDDYTGPDVMFIDGRLTPLVHRLSEFMKNSLYGKLVRREIREFAKLADYASPEDWRTNTTFAGVVKRPGISWFAPLVFWYIETEYSDDEANPQKVYRPPVSDVVLPHLLFIGLSDHSDPPAEDGVYTTARVLRRFSDNSIPQYDLPPEDSNGNPIKLDNRDEWLNYFEKIRSRREERGQETIGIEDFERFGFAELCANVGTVMCYAGPANLYQGEVPGAVRLPRIEVIANPVDDASEAVNMAISLYAKTNVEDEAHAAEGFSDINELPVVVPAVIKRSDKMAKEASNRVKEEVKNNMSRLAAELIN